MIGKRTVARLLALGMALLLFSGMPPVQPAQPFPMTEAEEALLVRCTVQFAADEPFVCQVCVAAALLSRLRDARYPDTVSGIAADAGMVALPIREEAWAQALSAVRLARIGAAPSGSATEWDKRGRGRLRVTFAAGEMEFGNV